MTTPKSPTPTRASHCSCGRPARVSPYDGGKFGPTAYCGIAQPPLDACDCGQGAERHDRSVCHIYGIGMTAAPPVVRVTSAVQMTLTQAVARTRQSADDIEHARRTGDLRSLTPRDLDAWCRGRIAAVITPGGAR